MVDWLDEGGRKGHWERGEEEGETRGEEGREGGSRFLPPSFIAGVCVVFVVCGWPAWLHSRDRQRWGGVGWRRRREGEVSAGNVAVFSVRFHSFVHLPITVAGFYRPLVGTCVRVVIVVVCPIQSTH